MNSNFGFDVSTLSWLFVGAFENADLNSFHVGNIPSDAPTLRSPFKVPRASRPYESCEHTQTAPQQSGNKTCSVTSLNGDSARLIPTSDFVAVSILLGTVDASTLSFPSSDCFLHKINNEELKKRKCRFERSNFVHCRTS